MAHLQLYKEKLSEKEELVRLTKEQRDAAERRLKGLEKLILRAEPGRPLPSVRASMPSVSLRSLPHPEVSS